MQRNQTTFRGGGTRIGIGVVVLLLLATALLPSPKSYAAISESRLQRLHFFYRFEQGRDLFQAGSYLEAAAHFQSLMGEYADLPAALRQRLDYYLGASLVETGLYAWGKTHLDTFLADQNLMTPLVVDGTGLLLRVHAHRGEAATAATLYETAIAKPMQPALRLHLDYAAARAFYRLGRQARQAQDRAASGLLNRVRNLARTVQPNNEIFPRIVFLAALAMIEDGEFGAAVIELERLLAQQDQFRAWDVAELTSLATIMLAQTHFDQGNYQQSLNVAGRIESPGLQSEVLYLQAWNYLMLERFMRGLEAFRDLAVAHPEDPRSIEASWLGGYILLAMEQFDDSYRHFVTLETQFASASERIKQFRKGFPGEDALVRFLRSDDRIAEAPLPVQLFQWIKESRRVVHVEAAQKRIASLGRRIRGLNWDVRRMRVISAGFGTSFDNPATLERLLRNEAAVELTQVRSQILELMLRPIRNRLLAHEYRIVNLAQEARRSALKVIRETAVPTKRNALMLQKNLREVRDYVQLVAPEDVVGRPDPATAGVTDVVELEAPPGKILDRLIRDEENLAFILLDIISREEALWAMIASTIQTERQAAESALRRNGLWGKQAYLKRLESMYRSTQGIERLVRENGQLLVEIQEHILNDVLAFSDDFMPDVRELEEAQAALAQSAERMQSDALVAGFDQTIRLMTDAEARAGAGKLDVGWRLKEVEESLLRNVQDARRRRLAQLDRYYENVESSASSVSAAVGGFDTGIRARLDQSAIGEQMVEAESVVESVGEEIERLNQVVEELQRGTAWILERPGRASYRSDREGR